MYCLQLATLLLCLAVFAVRAQDSSPADSTTSPGVEATTLTAVVEATSTGAPEAASDQSSIGSTSGTFEVTATAASLESSTAELVETTVISADSAVTTTQLAEATGVTPTAESSLGVTSSLVTSMQSGMSPDPRMGTSEMMSKNTTEQLEETTSLAITTTAAETTTAPPTTITAVPVCGKSVEDIDSSSECHPDKHKVMDLTSDKCDQLPSDEWIRFVSGDSCRQIPLFTDDTCFQPGSCNSEFPYYMSGAALPGANGTNTVKFCTTDSGRTKSAYCCLEAIDIEVTNCSDHYFIYKLSKAMETTPCGKVCLTPPSGISPFEFIIADGDSLQLKVEDLNDSQQDNLVALKLIITEMHIFQGTWREATNSLTEKVEEELNKRTKRSTPTKEIKVDVLDGFPRIDEDEMEALYVLYAHDDEGNPVAKGDVEEAVKGLKDQDPLESGSGSKVGPTTDLPPELVGKPAATAPTVDEQPKATDSNLWIAIIIIIGVTAFIVAIAFIAVGCYSFSRRGRSGAMDITQHKEGLVGDDELNNSYTVTGGHINVAMEDDEGIVDSNQNANSKTVKDTNNIEMQQVEDNAV